MLYLAVAKPSRITGRLLGQLLQERGVQLTTDIQRADAGVSYGVHVGNPTIPFLNARAGALNKYSQFEVMAAAVVLVPTYGRGFDSVSFPKLGRADSHRGGTDIKMYLQRSDLRTKGPSDFYVEWIPSETEYRHWMYRGRHLGTYEKVQVRRTRNHSIGRNYDTGYAFELVHSNRLPNLAGSIDQARLAVESLGLDFGAVDVLAGENGRPYVLEVNTGPGVADGRRQVIQALADKIHRWITLGYPKRRSENRAH